MSVYNRLELRNSSNVLGIIRGAVEPGERPVGAPGDSGPVSPPHPPPPRPAGPTQLPPTRVSASLRPPPARYVLYGNHRDSWVHGAVDPSSGTAVLLELSRVLGTLLKKGEAARPAVWGLSAGGHPHLGVLPHLPGLRPWGPTCEDTALASLKWPRGDMASRAVASERPVPLPWSEARCGCEKGVPRFCLRGASAQLRQGFNSTYMPCAYHVPSQF